MALSKKPVNGMKDILPAEMEIRDYVTSVIKDTYRSFGFTPIETPCMENIANLSNKQGGENEKLIFKILKRGEKLKLEQRNESSDDHDIYRDAHLVRNCRSYERNEYIAEYQHEHCRKSHFKSVHCGSRGRKRRTHTEHEHEGRIVLDKSICNQRPLTHCLFLPL